MKTEKRYYSTAEVQTILSCSRTKANEIMHLFEKRGKLFRMGNMMRVEKKALEDFIRQHTAEPA